MKKIAIIGVGGRTGTMFYFELKNFADVFGFGKSSEVDLIKNKKIFIKRNGKEDLFEGKVFKEFEFPKGNSFDFLFLAVKNPVAPAVKYYYQKIKEKNLKLPALCLSQNGIEAGESAISVLKEIFGKEAENIQVIRISLFNPVDRKILNEKHLITYSLPIKLALAKIFGPGSLKEIVEIFKKANFEFEIFPQKEAKNMEYSKLFLNLIGMASASHGFAPREGFLKKEIFRREILAIKEYIKVVKKAKGRFLNFKSYPVKIFSFFFSLPFGILFPFRKFFAKLVEKGRKGKPKDLAEIEYYNGVVLRLGKKFGIETPINEKILKRVKNQAE
jgi:ketopantoate reductase